MARGLSATLQTEVAEATGDIAHLVEINHSGGTLRWTTHSQDVDADVGSGVVTWVSIGGAFSFEAVEETFDPRGQGVTLRLSGVDTTIISTILSNDMRGRLVKVFRAHFADDGTVADVLEIFRGFQNREYRVTEQIPEDGGPGDPKAEVTTRVVSRLAELQLARPVRMNPTSHNAMLDRAGVAGAGDDTFLEKVVTIQNKQIFWGREAPITGGPFGTGSDPGGGEDDRGTLI